MVSIIIPVFNVESYLPRCIESVLQQSFRFVEIILVDDGSTDGSAQICDNYAKRDCRIRVIHKKNGGLSDARNVGIDMANGEFITFIDSDDYILPNYISYLYNLIIENNADISVCQLINVDEQDKILSTGGKAVNRIISGNKQCMSAFVKDTAIDTTAWRKLYKTSLFSSGIRYPVGKYHEDVYTTYRLIAKCNIIAIGEEALYAYRQRSGSIVNSSFTPKHLDAIYGNLERYKFISEKYPDLESIVCKGVIHAANQCVMRMGVSRCNQTDYINLIQPLYRNFLFKYLKSNCRIASKIFAICGWVSVRQLINLISNFRSNVHS